MPVQPLFGGDNALVQLLPFTLLIVISIIPSWHLFRKLEMSPAWGLASSPLRCARF